MKDKDRKYEIAGILLILISVMVFLSLIFYNPLEEPTISPQIAVTNKMGIVGVYVAHFLIKFTMGYASFIFPVLGILWGWRIFSRRSFDSLKRISFYTLFAALLICTAMGFQQVLGGRGEVSSYGYSGLVGGVLAKLIYDFLGAIGAFLLLTFLSLLLIHRYFDWSLYSPFKFLGAQWIHYLEKRRQKLTEKQKQAEKVAHTQTLLTKLRGTESQKEADGAKAEEVQVSNTPKSPSIETVETLESAIGREKSEDHEVSTHAGTPVLDDSKDSYIIGEEIIEQEVDLNAQNVKVPRRAYQFPPLDLLEAPEEITPSATHEELVQTANTLVQALYTFGVEGKVVNISPGPVITLFEMEPAEGVRVNKFVQLSDDLARVMEAERVRVIAPIPGKATVGIEIPNKNPSIVYLKSVISSRKYVGSPSKLTVALGKTTSGENFVIQLDKLPHLLIAGTTGSGKSVCINSIITSILYRATPEEVRFMLIDLKKLELASYKVLEKHHLITGEDLDEFVITTPENAVLALRAAEREMGRRYDILANAVVRNIQEYHLKVKDNPNLELMPYLVIVIDELADLILRAPREVELPIARLAQMARAVGIHLVLATQRPSVDVITGVIKANFPARIAFQMATRIDSRTILDTMGAEKLLGRGDMLFLAPGSSEPIRIHNSYVSLEDITRVVNHIASQPTPGELKLESVKIYSAEGEFLDSDPRSDDELYNEAVRLVVTHQQGSISLLQRRLKIGYSRAARLIDMMEQTGIVGPFTGSKAREVLVDESYLMGLDDNEKS